MSGKQPHDEEVPLLDEIVEHDDSPQPPPNLDLFAEPETAHRPNRAALQAALAGQLNAWLADALPRALREIEPELLHLLEQKLVTELPALVQKSLDELHEKKQD